MRFKIYFVIILLLVAFIVSLMIYKNGGFAFSTQEENIAFCGTQSSQSLITNINGKVLFQANCASCHSITKDLSGPALAGFQKRITKKLFYQLIQQPKKAYKNSKYLQVLKHQYNDLEHFPFPALSKKDIDDIQQYIIEAEIPIP